ncbi:NPFF2-like protein [Mya arenaria]|uniref:NPFF2-like protein n=2 Tax=Mya arenaria TaxID=6604 RepID=A0ABY7DRD4_MYAAR|nr:NPFF2-like protein [Mya arenaria]
MFDGFVESSTANNRSVHPIMPLPSNHTESSSTVVKMLNNSTLPSDDNMTTAANTAELIQRLNDEMARLMLPATIYIVVLMVLGLIGNVMVCFFYGCKTKRTTNTYFIVILALYDIIVCAISMPTELVDIQLYYTFENNVACKILRFVNYFAGIGSILTLVAIATDRFKKICRATQPQLTFKTTRFVSVGIIGIAIFLSWPSLLIYGSIKVPIDNEYGLDLWGSDCTSTKDKAYRKYVWMFKGVHILLFIILSITLIVLYSIIGNKIFSHNKNLQKHRPFQKQTSNKDAEISFTNTQTTTTDERVSKDSKDHSASTLDRGTHSIMKNHVGTKTSVIPPKNISVDKESVRITMVMIIVTVIFILSFLPYLSLTVWRIVEGNYEALFLSGAGLVGFNIGTRSFMLNSSLNPWIYGIFNRNFRRFFFGWCCDCFAYIKKRCQRL